MWIFWINTICSENSSVLEEKTQDKEMVIDIMKEDPFYKNEIAEYEFIEFIPTKFDEKFAYFVNN